MRQARRAQRVLDVAIEAVIVLLLLALPVALAQTEVGQQVLKLVEQPTYYGPRSLI